MHSLVAGLVGYVTKETSNVTVTTVAVLFQSSPIRIVGIDGFPKCYSLHGK
jgi:hypothetical protein